MLSARCGAEGDEENTISKHRKSTEKIEFKITLKSMKWNMPTFVESRTFDTRLTKSALLQGYKGDTSMLSQRPDYRQFKSNYPKES